MTNCCSSCGGKKSSADDASPERKISAGGKVFSVFLVADMDCPSEERMIRLALEGIDGVGRMEFDLVRRELRVWHEGPSDPIEKRLETLELGSRLVSTSTASDGPAIKPSSPDVSAAAKEASVLGWALAINAVMFLGELVAGWLAQSTGLIADSLDMFADAAVYGVALYAVGRDPAHKVRAARLSGWLQLLLALGAMAEVLRRFAFGSEPKPPLMMGVAFVALLANTACLLLLMGHRQGGIHMKASWIFSTNDVLANLGVIVAGALVAWTGSNTPDLVIGTFIALLVLNGARRILRLSGAA